MYGSIFTLKLLFNIYTATFQKLPIYIAFVLVNSQ